MSSRNAWRLGVGATLAAVATFAGTATPVHAAPVLQKATASVDVDENGTASVQLRYRVTAKDKPAESLTFSALRFGDAKAGDVSISTGAGEPLDVDVEQADLKTAVTATLDSPVQPGKQMQLLVEYEVPDATETKDGRMTVEAPVLVLDDPAADTTSGIFTADVQLPPGYRYVEGFPANPEKVANTGDRTQVRYDTPAAVSLLRVVSTPGKAPWWTLSAAGNLALGAVLVAGAVAFCLSLLRRRRRTTAHGEGRA